MHRLKHRLSVAIRRTALGGIGVLLALVGIGFLTAAGYIYLSAVTTSLEACLILGGAFVGVGMLFALLARPSVHHEPIPAAHTATADPATLVTTFMAGVAQGIAARRQL